MIYAKIALCVGLFLFGWWAGGLQGKAALARLQRDQAQITATAVLAERASAQAVAITDRQAETQHDQDLEAIPLHIRHDSVFVRVPGPAPNCPVPGTQAQTGEPHPVGGGTDGGRGERDIRPGLERLEAKYEIALADCRRLDAEWPK